MQKLVACLFLVLLAGCASDASEVTAGDFEREFFSLSSREQLNKFSEYGVDVQYQLLIVGNQIVHPPAIYLSDAFAKNGRAAIPLMKDKLSATKSEATIRDIVSVLSEMHRTGSYDVKTDSDLFALARSKVFAMKGQWRQICVEMIDSMK